MLFRSALSLINRQKAEIAALKHEIPDRKYGCCVSVKNGLIYTHTLDDYDWLIGDISADGIKEFADRLKDTFDQYGAAYDYYAIIDKLVKEMAGGQNAND